MLEPVSERVDVECGLPPAALWPLVSDTDRLNRVAGLSEVHIRPNPEGGVARHIVTAKFGPLTLEWAELPFEWRAPERLSVRREVVSGLVCRIDFELTLRPQGSGSVVTIEVALTPRQRTAQPIAAVAARVVARRLADGVKRLSSSAPLEPATRVDAKALQSALTRLVEGAPEAVCALVPRLRAHLESGAESEVARLRPYELAEAWGAPRRATLELFLRAVVAGALELSWDVVCPSCRTAANRLPDLSALDAEAHCEMCDIGFGVDMDRAVEASFRPSGAVRPVPEATYCTGGPGATPHVVSQVILQPDQPKTVSVPAAAGRYRLFVRGGCAAPVEVAPKAPEQVQLRLAEGEVAQGQRVAPGGQLRVRWAGEARRHAKLEHLHWASRAATAYEVLTVPVFRRYFGAAALKPGLGLGVRRAVLFFSDLSASTALYAREGDAAAFRLVQDHFDLLEDCIRRHDGAIVKTIGDAVMASFVDERSALRAAMTAQAAFPAFRAAHPASLGVYLKIGVYAGPCYAVTANRSFDFFGQTVNIAARLQGQAGDGEVVFPADWLVELEDEVDGEGVTVSGAFTPLLKGVDCAPEVRRLSFPSARSQDS